MLSLVRSCILINGKAPLYIVAPSEDDLFPPEQQNRTQEILTKGGKHFSMQVYSGVGHGFAVSFTPFPFSSNKEE